MPSTSSSHEGAHVHEWGGWAPYRTDMEQAHCACGADKARKAEPLEDPYKGLAGNCGTCESRRPDCALRGGCDRDDCAAECRGALDAIKRVMDAKGAEPEEGFECPGWPECPVRGSCPGCADEPAPKELAPRRPPYAVAYAVEGGALYEVALSGDATVIAEDGVLQIIHPSRAVLGITRVTPMNIEERSADDGAQ